MASLESLYPEQVNADFDLKCDQWMQNAEKQKAAAGEMIKCVQAMCRRAEQMRNPRRFCSI
jgi:hypothetical protein